ncbi:two-component sensor histidine kinase [Selenomonas sp. oral taxon 126]|uniref:sensor histidine kinase n=1 Tax=Selenomonas sp. oral taxon 126 TaxID=712528 RepID=UPI00080776B5|nr:ATP-binding protein [Selenomonas sp. oral taxon 126]ANR71347.1 two-component sensor histidine kinase [Selenomonas sp. oral taxon 126]
MNEQNVFGRSRLRLMLRYALVMGGLVIVLLFAMHKTMEWAITSEQARELLDTADSVSESQAYALLNADTDTDETQLYRSTNDRLFYYVFDGQGRLVSFSRASYRIESFVLDIVGVWDAPEREVRVFTKTNERGAPTKVMMTAQTVFSPPLPVQTVYVGKDVTAMYNGMEKATWALAVLGGLALICAAAVGYVLSGGAMKPVREAYERQRQFAADASHELRTPLAVVLASADLLLTDPSIKSPFLKQVIEDVRDEVKKMTKLVSDLLTVARTDGSANQLKPVRMDLVAAAQQTVRIMRPFAEKKDIVIAEELPKRAEINADEQKIRQLILILVDNAVKYTPEHGRITVSVQEEKGGVQLSVADTGIGIAPEDQERIFDRFYRVDKARSRRMGGNGLGLAIAREIVEAHGGTIAVESEPGKGTTFRVHLKTRMKN